MALRDFVRYTRSDLQPQASALTFRINNFDIIRFFAAVQVAIFHSYERFEIPIPAYMVPLSWFPGVPIFFVISGFLMAASFERSANVAQYATNRALRIFPGLWGVLFMTLVAIAVVDNLEFSAPVAIWFITQMFGLIYTPAFLADFGSGSYNGSLWTIPVELQFYIALPILYTLAARFRFNTRPFFLYSFLIALAFGASVTAIFPSLATANETPFVKLLRYTFIPRFYMFLFGVVLYKFNTHVSSLIRGQGLYWFAAYLLFHILVPTVGPVYIIAELFLAVAMISLAYTWPTISERILRGNDISYGTYLYHGLIINIILEMGVGIHQMALTLSLSILAALLSWYLIEQPSLRLKRACMLRFSRAASAAL